MWDINPFRLAPAKNEYFVGRDDLLIAWRERLQPGSTPWKEGKSWLILASGGIGKTSLLMKLMQVGVEEYKAHPIFIDFGEYRDRQNPEGFLESFENHISTTHDSGTYARKIIGLPPSASNTEVTYRYAAELLNVAGLAYNFSGGVEIGPVLPQYTQSKPEDLAIRMAGIFEDLVATGKRYKHPIMVFIDQLDKAYDSDQWSDMARLLLALILKLRNAGKINIVFVIAMRPERYGLLDSRIQNPGLFAPYLFARKYLHPFNIDEARLAIQKRGQGHFGPGLEVGIIREVSQNGEVDPYAVMQASSAIWVYLYGSEQQRSPSMVKSENIRTIITEYYSDLTRYFQRSSSLWSVLQLLINYPGGLSVIEIANKLRNTRMTHDEVEAAIMQLLNQRGYQVIKELEETGSYSRYAIAHELLGEALLQHLPEKQRLAEQAKKTLDDAMWRYKYRDDVLSEKELQTIWQNRRFLNFHRTAWDAITTSILINWSLNHVEWIDAYSEDIINATLRILDRPVPVNAIYRGLLIIVVYQKSDIHWIKLLEYIAQYSTNPEMRIRSAKKLISRGRKEFARDVLIKLIHESDDYNICKDVTEILVTMSESSQGIFYDLAKNNREEVRLLAAQGLIKLSANEIARDILINLTRRSKREGTRCEAARSLGEIGEVLIAKKVLEEIVKYGNDLQVRQDAIEGLISIGEASKDDLLMLLGNSKDLYVHLIVSHGLIDLGEDQIAKEILRELVTRGDFQIKQGAFREFFRLRKDTLGGYVHLPINWEEVPNNSLRMGKPVTQSLTDKTDTQLVTNILVELVCNSESESIASRATQELITFGEGSRSALVVLTQTSEMDWVRFRAALGLIKFNDIQIGKEVLFELASRSKNKWVRWSAINALSRLGQPAWEFLSNLANSDGDEYILYKSTVGLVGLGEIQQAKKILSKLAQNSNNRWIRQMATENLIRLGEISRKELIQLANTSKDINVRLKVIEKLIEYKERDITREALVDLVRKTIDRDFQKEACKLLLLVKEVSVFLDSPFEFGVETMVELDNLNYFDSSSL